MLIFLLNTLVFLASFLIFQSELIFGKIILPGFGGGYLVWGISVVFYQGVLFLGYLYIHLLNRYFRFSQYRLWHTALMLLSLLFLHINVERLQAPTYELPAVIEIIYLLSTTMGPLFFILSGLSVYAQIRLSASTLPERENPYVLYAASNLGAFMALFAYPFFIEPRFDTSTQLVQWETAYVVVLVLAIIVQWAVPSGRNVERLSVKITACNPSQVLRWLLLSAAGSAMFLSVTNDLTFNLAPVPLLWIIPLAIYLLTLVLTFKKNPFCPVWIQNKFHLFMSLGVFLFLFKSMDHSVTEYLVATKLNTWKPLWVFGLFFEPLLSNAICFVFCLVCHFRLNESKPPEAEQLTLFYLASSAGGFLGGVLINWIVPLGFNSMVEFLVSCLLAACAFAITSRSETFEKKFIYTAIAIFGLVFLWPKVVYFYNSQLIKHVSAIAGVMIFILFSWLKGRHQQVLLVLLGLIVAVPFVDHFKNSTIIKKRDFYGIYTVMDYAGFRYLLHGNVVHGAQRLEGPKKDEPLTYFHRDSPAGEFLYKNPLNFSQVGLVGLGTGSLVAYARPSDHYVYYEIDPLVGELAQKHFTFISNSRGRVRMIYGDARVSMRKEPPAIYDAIVVDVFNSGSVPVHLITVEAINEYLRLLKPNGVIFFHATNDYLDLVSVLSANAVKAKLFATIKYTGFDNPPEKEGTLWLALTRERSTSFLLQANYGWQIPTAKSAPPWTDRYSSLFSVIK